MKVFKIMLPALLMAVMISCGHEAIEEIRREGRRTMEFEATFPGETGTRARNSFVNGAQIHVTAKIDLIDSAQPVCLTTVLTYSSGKWLVEAGHDRLYWPGNATGGVFTAYSLPDNAEIGAQGSSAIIDFDRLTEESDDPLVARTRAVTNGVIHFQFSHMLTKLRVSGLPAGTAQTFDCATYPVVNRIIFSHDAIEGYSHRYAVNEQHGGVTATVSGGQANFFIHAQKDEWQAHSDGFRLTQKSGGQSDRTTPLGSVRFYDLQPGNAYYITFSGAGAPLEVNDARWYEPSQSTRVFNDEAEIVEYFSNLSQLTEDLDFNNILLTAPISPAPGYLSSRSVELAPGVFDGNFHTIKNARVTNGLFDVVPAGATLRNLQLENITLYTGPVDDRAIDCAGLLTPVNRGTIENIMLKGNNTVSTHNAAYVGGLAGVNKGTISAVTITGSLVIESYLPDEDITPRVYCVGGLIGANGDSSTDSRSVFDCHIRASATLAVAGGSNAVDARVGGLVGFNATCAGGASISNCSTHARVDASGLLRANNCSAGGFAGENYGVINICKATGEVAGGWAEAISSTGGFAGHAASRGATAILNRCNATGDVSETDTEGDVYTGGMSGFVEIDINNCGSTGTVRTGGGNARESRGAMTGMISSDKNIINSFSMSTSPDDPRNFPFSGLPNSKIQNCHFSGWLLEANGTATDRRVTAAYMNIAVNNENGYQQWTSSSSVYEGCPYLATE
jgi:hypothetical protein